MLPDQQAEIQEWLHRGRLDEVTAEQLLTAPRIVPETAVFHCQQLAAKALKAYLVSTNVSFPRTHDLVRLIEMCCGVDQAFAELLDIAVLLTPYATLYRYPTDEPAPDAELAKQQFERARRVLTFVLDRLPPDVRR